MTIKKVAVVCNTGLGDAILFERLAHALSEEGKQCTVFGHYLEKFSSWYPYIEFKNYPEDIENPFSSFWSYYDGYIFQEYAPGSHVIRLNKWVLGENYRLKNESWRMHQERFLKDIFGIENPRVVSSIKAPEGYEFRKFPKRVLIHPTSLKEEKNWPVKKFIALAQQLKLEGYDPCFCVSEGEKELWQGYLKSTQLALYVLPLSELCALVYESGYFIGNDSGISHLASALGIPSLKIFDRASRARFWSGGWDRSHEVTPWPLPSRLLRVKYWKNFLSVARVLRRFKELTAH